LIARALLRPQDRLTACELEPNARKQLTEALRRDTQARVVDLDGWVALSAFVPPNERRGLVLIDPPFEAKDEFERMENGFATAFAKWPTGSYLLWYPAKSRRATDQLAQQVAGIAASAASPGKCLRLEFSVAPQMAGMALASAQGLPTDPQIAAIVVAANQVDINAGKLAEHKAHAADVRAFAKRMVTDHTGVNKAAVALVTKLHVTPEGNATAQSLRQGGEQNIANLKTLKGAAFDKAYIDHEVTYHQAVLDAMDKALIPGAKNPELKALLVKVRPAFVDHLEHAKHIQSKLGGQ